jgi:hypothetical protein
LQDSHERTRLAGPWPARDPPAGSKRRQDDVPYVTTSCLIEGKSVTAGQSLDGGPFAAGRLEGDNGVAGGGDAHPGA